MNAAAQGVAGYSSPHQVSGFGGGLLQPPGGPVFGPPRRLDDVTAPKAPSVAQQIEAESKRHMAQAMEVSDFANRLHSLADALHGPIPANATQGAKAPPPAHAFACLRDSGETMGGAIEHLRAAMARLGA